jgi:hypothetical protein
MTNTDLKNLRDHILNTYFLLCVGIALIGILFPLILWFGGLIIGVQLQGSISAYYHTPMRNIFVGSLFSIGTFLYLYKGFSTQENIALNFAGIFALCVALLPTSAIVDLKCDTFTAPYLHGVSALLFFIIIAYVCIFRSKDTLAVISAGSPRRNFYERLYKILGILMIFLPFLSALLLHLLGETHSIVFFVEFAGVWVFSAYWIFKSREISETNIDNLVVQKTSLALKKVE